MLKKMYIGILYLANKICMHVLSGFDFLNLFVVSGWLFLPHIGIVTNLLKYVL